MRGHVVSYRADPFVSDDALVDVEDALVVTSNGLVTAFGPYAATRDRLPDDAEVTHYPDALLCAGFVDSHTHYVQTDVIGGFGCRLIDWLDHYTFAEEQRFADKTYADVIATRFFDQLLTNGTTTAAAFCATYPESVDAFFEESTRRRTRMIGGKVLMDRDAPAPLLDTAQRGYDDSKVLIGRWHGRGRNLYAISPRFAPTSSPEQLRAAGALRAESADSYVHTHIAENVEEVRWVLSLFPDRAGYLDVYDHYGLLGPRSLLAHGVHLTRSERQRVHETGAAVVHCPTSNLFLGSGLFNMAAAKDTARPMRVALGTDVGAGTTFSMLATMNEAYKVGELTKYPMSAVKLFYLATLGGAEALGLADKIGSIEVGKEADFVVLDPKATPLLAARSARAESTAELMFVLSTLGDDRAVTATYVDGQLAYRRGDAVESAAAG